MDEILLADRNANAVGTDNTGICEALAIWVSIVRSRRRTILALVD